MILRGLALENLRRFTDPVEVQGIGAGLNLLAAPNEAGKSTLVLALEALLTRRHSSASKEVKLLQPYAGGAPMVRAEIDLPGGNFTITKRWLSRPLAQVHQGGQLIAQADAAEAWIATHLRPDPLASGSGLLWVHQGVTRLPEADAEGRAGRRSLLTALQGEVSEVSGVQRLDAVIAACTEDLAAYESAKGRVTGKTLLGGAEARLQSLRDEEAALSARVASWRSALQERRETRAALAQLEAPETWAARQTALTEAEAAFAQAEARQAAARAAETDLRLAQQAAQTAEAERLRWQNAASEAEAAAQALAEAKAAQAPHLATLATAQAHLSEATQGLHAAQALAKAAESDLSRALRRETLVQQAMQQEALRKRLDQAEAAAAEEAQAAPLAEGPRPEALQRLTALDEACTAAKARLAAEAPRIRLSLNPGQEGKLTLGEAPLEAGAWIPITEEVRLRLGDLGALTIDPAMEDAREAQDRAEQAFAAALEALGHKTLAEAQAAGTAAEVARQRLIAARTRVDALAPEGLPALRAAFAALPVIEALSDGPSQVEAEAEQGVAQTRLRAAEQAQGAARAAENTAIRAKDRAQAQVEAAAERLARAQAALAEAPEPQSLTQAEAAAQSALAAAQVTLTAARKDLPDLTQARADLEEARATTRAFDQRHRELEQQLARLEGEIAAGTGAGLEEALRGTEAARAEAEAEVARHRFDREVLRLLLETLTEARREAQSAYFAPLETELRPLLARLWGEAEVRWSEETLLPTELLRGGQNEALAALSQGAQEQVALLVRLAYARLLAKRGDPRPVILDDALVFADETRMAHLFDTLRQEAEDQQILVLTCREGLFDALGGTRLSITPGPSLSAP